MSPEARDHSFDELTRGLASGTLSRGKALRLMGAALVGGALASIPGIASAKPNKPEGAKCNHDHQCASGQCVRGVCSGCASGSRPCGTSCCPDERCLCASPVGGGETCFEADTVIPGNTCADCTGTENPICLQGEPGVLCAKPCPA
jgi:hypothetical protein